MAARPRVAVMCFSDNNGGMELDTIKLARLLDDSCEVTLLCKQDSFIHKRMAEAGDIDHVAVRFSSRTFSPAMLFKVRRVLKQKKLNNVVFFGASELKTLYFSFLGLDVNVTVRHGTTKSHRKHGPLHRLIYSCVDHHVALSKHLLRNVEYIMPPGGSADYRIIHPSFDLHEGGEMSATDGMVRLVHVGRMAEGKGQIDAVRACAQLYKKGIDFRFNLLGALGEDDYSRSLQREVESCSYSENIVLQGFIDDTPSFLRESDIFLFPSAGEGMPNAYIEALHHGLVCISYDNTVFPEFQEMGFYVRLVKDGDLQGLSATLAEVASSLDEEKRRAAGNAALARQYFQADRELADWHALFIS